MRWLSPVTLAAVLAAAVWAGARGGAHSTAQTPAQAATPQVSPDQDPIRFETMDVFVDPGATALAAWQLEVTPRTREGTKVTLVGIEGGGSVEGGAHAAFAKPAYYDPAALSPEGGGRVILAAYSTSNDLPTGRTRVARLHVMIEGDAPDGTTFDVTLRIAADAQGRAIDGASAAGVPAAEASTGGDR